MTRLSSTFPFIRIVARDSSFLSRRTGSLGEIFYNRETNTLQVFDGDAQGGFGLAKANLTNVSNTDFLNKAIAAGVGTGGGGGGGGNVSVSVSSTVPASPSNGNLWLNTNNGSLYVYINDGDSQQWIQPSFPASSLEGYATENYVDTAVANVTFTLPTASTTVLGGVKVDGTTITINGQGVISGAITYQLPTASTSVLGGVKVDGTSITINGEGVISGIVPTIFDQDLNTTNDVTFNTVTAGQLISNGTGTPTYTSGGDFIFNTGSNNGSIVVNGSVEATKVLSLTPLSSAPTAVAGSFAVADGIVTGWDPAAKGLNTPYPVFYNGSTWTALY